jgi:SET domain-containing protein
MVAGRVGNVSRSINQIITHVITFSHSASLHFTLPHRGDLLSIDAGRVGNVSRFINHSCEPNLHIQPVFARDARNMLYYNLTLFAGQDIPAGTQLTYDYGPKMSHAAGNNCMCGAPTCSSRVAREALQHEEIVL